MAAKTSPLLCAVSSVWSMSSRGESISFSVQSILFVWINKMKPIPISLRDVNALKYDLIKQTRGVLRAALSDSTRVVGRHLEQFTEH